MVRACRRGECELPLWILAMILIDLSPQWKQPTTSQKFASATVTGLPRAGADRSRRVCPALALQLLAKTLRYRPFPRAAIRVDRASSGAARVRWMGVQ